MSKRAGKGKVTVNRSAISERFVKASTAARHPKTTVTETRSKKSK
ncbi:alkaline shock response membrane anchor protein AmaP [Corynebacterium pseudokroppenstedtii]|uniref:Alkaline shock response membrane anchor protein AmaP n=1 Tax=Corynebacterium pseudokroppenstedtii TaxID=2804917 RepID=A0AAU0PVR7_9CORY|nr:alkaline shock response membrane anchor protein AmaP [Corynebacterium pseudokroppenstedtii]MCF8703313.1 alkaline shock response membrane anchor protein AmaP [Corynebacterium pseudokroppenstedtii]MCG2636824.1 alkaline shock response membrane anchor protein AmaP [Corynebacterium pseudokroppenstedtii]